MNLKELMAAAIKAAKAIADQAVAENRDLTDDEFAQIEAKEAEIADLKEKIERAAKSSDTVARLKGLTISERSQEPEPEAKATPGTIGERFIESDGFKSFRKENPNVTPGNPINVKATGVGGLRDLGIGKKATITTQTGFTGPQRDPEGYVNALPYDEPLAFLDLVTTGTTDVAYSQYARIVSETDNAAIVAEGELKPLSDITTGLAESKAFVYADGFDITNQTLADEGALAALMEQRIRRHVQGVVADKLLNGTGTATEPQGILNTTGTLAQAFDTDVITTIAAALAKFEAANGDLAPQAIIMNPADAWKFRLLRENGATGAFLLGNPLQQGVNATPFGVPIVRTNAITAGTALVGRVDSMHLLELDPLNVLAFNQHKDYAQRNMVYVRAEMRARQVFYAPREVVVTDLTA